MLNLVSNPINLYTVMASSLSSSVPASNVLRPALALVRELTPDESRHLLREPCIQTSYQVRPILYVKKKGKILCGLGPCLKPLDLSSTQVSGSEEEEEVNRQEEITSAGNSMALRGRAQKRARVG